MLKLSLKPGEFITLGDNIKIIFSEGSANNIHLLVDALREINVARNSAGKDKKPSPYYKEKGISKTAQREIAEILMREKRNQSHVSGEETVTDKKRQKARRAWGHIENFCSVMSRFFGTVGHIESFLCIMSLKSVAMGHIAFFLAYMSRETKEKGHSE